MGRTWELGLGADALEWRDGKNDGRIFYDQIKEVLLWYRQGQMRRDYFAQISSGEGMHLMVCSFSFDKGRCEYKDGAYGAFIRELHRRIAQVGAKALFQTNLSSAQYRFQLGFLGVVGLVFLGLALLALLFAPNPLGAIILFLIFCAFATAFIVKRKNPPRRYQPNALPDGYVPRAY